MAPTTAVMPALLSCDAVKFKLSRMGGRSAAGAKAAKKVMKNDIQANWNRGV